MAGTLAMGANAITTSSTVDGRDVSVDGAKLDGIEAGATADQVAADVPFTPNGDIAATNVQTAIQEVRTDTDTKLTAKANTATSVLAGAGLTGGGTLAASRTLNVAAANGSITVAADSISVGVLTTDAMHGVRGGGTQHAAAIASGASGFMTGSDKAKLDGVEALADVTDATNVAAAGALMRSGGEMSGNITMAGAQTVDGRDVSADGSKLDGIEALADVTDAANVAAAGALMLTGTGQVTALTAKGSPASGDFVLLEDTADSGNLKKVDFSAFGGGGGGGDRGYVIVVGNSAQGDTLAECDYLDNGNGVQLAAALAAAALETYAPTVLLRRGLYQVSSLTIPYGVTLAGEGFGTQLFLPQSGAMRGVTMSGESTMRDLSLTHPFQATGTLTGTRFIEMESGSRMLRCRANVQAGDVTSAGYYPGFWSLVRMSQAQCVIQDCAINTYSSVALGGGNPAIAVLVTGTGCKIMSTDFGITSADRVDTGISLGESGSAQVTHCRVFRSHFAGINIEAGNGNVDGFAIQGCELNVSAGDGVRNAWFGDAIVTSVAVQNCIIKNIAGNGINFTSVSAARYFDGMSITGNILEGGGTGTGINIIGANTERPLVTGNVALGYSTQLNVTPATAVIGTNLT